MKSLQCIQNDVIVNFNNGIRTQHWALNIESTYPLAIRTFEWTLQVSESKKTIKFYFEVLKMLGLKESDSNITKILQYKKMPVVWNGPYMTCCSYKSQQYSEKILASL